MKKICFVNINAYSLFNPKSNASVGGTEVQLFNLASHFSKINKYQVFFIVGDWGQPKIVEKHGKIKVYKSLSLQKNFLNYIKAPFILWKRMKKVDANVYIASSAGVEIGIIALFCKIHKKKFIYRTASEIDCNGEYVKKNGWRGRIYQYGLRNANVVVTQNVEHKKILKSNYNIDAKILRNCYNIKKVDTQNKKYILWVGRCDEIKRPELFLRIVENFSNEKFVMIAPRSSHIPKLFDDIQKNSQKFNNLTFIKKVSYFEIQKYFNKAKLFIGTSDYEGFPNTYLQACIGGTPIISLNVDPDEFITKNNLGYCAKGDFSLMLENIKNILDNQNDWQEKSRNVLKYIKNKHNIELIGKEWERFLKDDNI